MVHSKLQQTSKTNLHAANKQMHIVIEDKENRRDMVNRQSSGAPPVPTVTASLGSNPQQSSSTTSLLKRSKTSDPSKAPLR